MIKVIIFYCVYKFLYMLSLTSTNSNKLYLAHNSIILSMLPSRCNNLKLAPQSPKRKLAFSSANVLLNPTLNNQWIAKLSDYSSANFVQSTLTAGPGNPTYAAPEANSPSKQGPKMDVYSYGVLLLEMCTRKFLIQSRLTMKLS